jgi:predicted GNAT superfamily acetyltransferase
VSWLVSSERVKARMAGISYSAPVNVGPSLVQVEMDDSSRRNDLAECLTRDHAAIEIPSNIDALPREIGLRWREDTRWAFTEALKAGYFVDAFVREMRGDKRIGKYILSRKKAQEDF